MNVVLLEVVLLELELLELLLLELILLELVLLEHVLLELRVIMGSIYLRGHRVGHLYEVSEVYRDSKGVIYMRYGKCMGPPWG